MLPGGARAQRLSARDFAEIPIKSTDREMTGLPGDFDEEAVGESKAWPPLKLIECRSHDLVILNRQTLMVEEDLNRPGDFRRFAIVDRLEYPRGFGQHQMRDPCPRSYECFGRSRLVGVISCDQPHQNIGVNGAHVVFASAAGSLLSSRHRSAAVADPPGKQPCADLRMCSARPGERRCVRRAHPTPKSIPGRYRAADVLPEAPRFDPAR
jgi:hypothetical protein